MSGESGGDVKGDLMTDADEKFAGGVVREV